MQDSPENLPILPPNKSDFSETNKFLDNERLLARTFFQDYFTNMKSREYRSALSEVNSLRKDYPGLFEEVAEVLKKGSRDSKKEVEPGPTEAGKQNAKIYMEAVLSKRWDRKKGKYQYREALRRVNRLSLLYPGLWEGIIKAKEQEILNRPPK
ncbi:hypothetical protein HYT02_03165 [Candidatus Gottesmanbacteria bacterium]|nr:hypothetical protein [Candidatus Gottesmanbacteria bacterium]